MLQDIPLRQRRMKRRRASTKASSTVSTSMTPSSTTSATNGVGLTSSSTTTPTTTRSGRRILKPLLVPSEPSNPSDGILFIGDDDDHLRTFFDEENREHVHFERDNNFVEHRLIDSGVEIDPEQEDRFYSTPFEQYNTQKILHKKVKSTDKAKLDLENVDSNIPSREDTVFENEVFTKKNKELTQKRMYEWIQCVRCDNNLLFYGVGSKIYALNQLMYHLKIVDTNGYFVIVSGFNPNVTADSILYQILKHNFKEKETKIKKLSSIEKVDYISMHLSRRNEQVQQSNDEDLGDFSEFVNPSTQQTLMQKQHLYICIHNIDGPSLRDKTSQQLLAVLASSRYIHLICSVDHQLSNLLWDDSLENKFGFMRFNITNFCTYFLESEHISLSALLSEGNTTTSDNEDEVAVGAIDIVFKTIASSSKKYKQIFIVICKKFIELESEKEKSTDKSTQLPSGCTSNDIKKELGMYAIDDTLLMEGLAFFDQTKIIKKLKQNLYAPTLKKTRV
ncbi:hypothetical protein FDP41_004127 [Naegleria fowleri]|uniref:Origin recognition complex subunit 2 n=1 Tax=Naegleria fowleri TaxID=5763 RepID=A0A6A5BPU4_NAEFO|nr:uncharacterized protein FDP41_004127 [Naegleria fowleri]KAF0976832.1 hypothetical protein FDP41_004127 [Naegleria fowleri]